MDCWLPQFNLFFSNLYELSRFPTIGKKYYLCKIVVSGAPIFALDIATINQQLRISHLPSRKALLGYMTSQVLFDE